ncbi:TIGR02186 family protein [Methylopila henanensis]|uniref:TIGR02186 family protein n=1 Tax=Methylopila henanensis TaxID=873516 RepID=A0ABW4KAV4_9HYPH
MRRAVLVLTALALGAPPARAEKLMLALSSQQVTIASNYAGADLTLFGAVRGARPGTRWDVIVQAEGPSGPVTVRRKEQVGPLWLNRATRAFARAPSFLTTLSSRPLQTVASPEDVFSERLGLRAVAEGAPAEGTRKLSLSEDAAFIDALIRLQTERGHWIEDGGGVTFLDRDLFRATIHLPPDIAFGPYQVDVRLYAGGMQAARETITFRVVKAGFEARVAALADKRRVAYGFVMALLALAFGWTASAVFRRD